MSQHQQEAKPLTLRGRDICAILAVGAVGLGVINIAMSQQPDAAGVLAFGSVAVAVVLLALGFGGGWMLDRFSARHPWATRNHFSTAAFLLIPPLCVALGVIVWQQRETIVSDAEQSARIVMTELNQLVTGRR